MTKQTQTTNIKQKGGTQMKTKNTKITVTTLQLRYYNNYQTYLKDNKRPYKYRTTEDMKAFIRQLPKERQQALITAWTTIIQEDKQFKRYTQNQDKLNRAYGKETIHYSELSQEEQELIKQYRNKQQEFKESKQQDKQLTKPHYTEKEEEVCNMQ